MNWEVIRAFSIIGFAFLITMVIFKIARNAVKKKEEIKPADLEPLLNETRMEDKAKYLQMVQDSEFEKAAFIAAREQAYEIMNHIFAIAVFRPFRSGVYTVYHEGIQKYEKPGCPSYDDLCKKYLKEELSRLGYEEKRAKFFEVLNSDKPYLAWQPIN